MSKTIHVCVSIKGALQNWSKGEWAHLAKANNMTVDAAIEQFRIMDFEGKKVLPFGPACEGFSYESGCPGHEAKEPQDEKD